MRDKDIEISVVIPVYNSAQTLRELRERLEKVLRDLVGESYEIVFVNDGSTDSSWDLLNEMASTSDKIVGVNLTRNFGQHNALMCGFSQAQGMYIITLDDDLQNPPEEIPKLFNEIQTGHDVVYGIFDIKQHSKFRNLGSEFVQFVYRKTFNMNIRISSFRIIRREIIQSIMSYEKSFTYIDGLISWFTNNIGSVLVEHHQRQEGKSGYSLKKLMVLALNMVTNFSIVPLQIASLTGLVFALVGFGFGIYFLLKKALLGMSISGFASTIVSITIFSGVQLVTAGILGEYIGRIHINVNKRPQYAIRDIVNEGKNET
jgi:undecaprenyl-phosphate 4-deoxy-4-formamido-L-arabinose transferase